MGLPCNGEIDIRLRSIYVIPYDGNISFQIAAAHGVYAVDIHKGRIGRGMVFRVGDTAAIFRQRRIDTAVFVHIDDIYPVDIAAGDYDIVKFLLCITRLVFGNGTVHISVDVGVYCCAVNGFRVSHGGFM